MYKSIAVMALLAATTDARHSKLSQWNSSPINLAQLIETPVSKAAVEEKIKDDLITDAIKSQATASAPKPEAKPAATPKPEVKPVAAAKPEAPSATPKPAAAAKPVAEPVAEPVAVAKPAAAKP